MTATRQKPVRLTAIVTCRNAEPTLERLLDNLADHGAEVIVIDNDSTDRTRQIANARKGDPVVGIINDPYRGYFDLTRQLHLKRDIINDIADGWIIHSDADEFLDGPNAEALSDYLGYWDASGVIAFGCNEQMFLPETEEDNFSCRSFQNDMTAYINLEERNPKQRLFRADAPLDKWMATGGHTISTDEQNIAPVRIALRHYFALSVDQIRSEYLSRVYAPHDLAKFWHSTRRAENFEIIPPPADKLLHVGNPKSTTSETRVPVFSPRRNTEAFCGLAAAPVDLCLAGFPEAITRLHPAIEQTFAGLRIAFGHAAYGIPVLHVLEHPAQRAAFTPPLIRAVGWLRQISGLRQTALLGSSAFREIRVEDAVERPDLLIETIGSLLKAKGVELLRREALTERSMDGYNGRLKAITASLARDLGYV